MRVTVRYIPTEYRPKLFWFEIIRPQLIKGIAEWEDV